MVAHLILCATTCCLGASNITTRGTQFVDDVGRVMSSPHVSLVAGVSDGSSTVVQVHASDEYLPRYVQVVVLRGPESANKW